MTVELQGSGASRSSGWNRASGSRRFDAAYTLDLVKIRIDADDSNNAILQHSRSVDGVAHREQGITAEEIASFHKVVTRHREQIGKQRRNVSCQRQSVVAPSPARENTARPAAATN